jgi:hypothetical protein
MRARHQKYREGQRREHADEFLEALSLAATEDYLNHNVHHRVLDSESDETEVLAVHMPSAFSAVKWFVRDSNLEEEYILLTKTDYTNSFSNKADVADSYVVATNKRTREIENGGKAVHFDHENIRQNSARTSISTPSARNANLRTREPTPTVP